MTPLETLERRRAIEDRNSAASRRAAWLAWSSVAAAAFAFGGIVLVATAQIASHRNEEASLIMRLSTASQELEKTRSALAKEQAELAATRSTLMKLEDERRGAEERLQRIKDQIVGSPIVPSLQPEQALKHRLEKPAVEKPPITPSQAGSSVQIQILGDDDRAYANEVSTRLREAGYVVVGIELREDAVLSHSDVRFYKQADRDEAARIASVLRQGGDIDAVPVWLKQFENSPKARMNHFEVWLAKGRRSPR